ncbi:MAG: type II toxin-antitoxin system PemK/MazF family toxin [Acidobacteria bacterium]|nr:type II toxin-antitoxin system PemK/MazF family toxin [Acidobacteriota bacterium]
MGTTARITYPRRGDVYWVSFDPTLGTEIKKRRPALILQNDIANRYSPITIVAAITSQVRDPGRPTNVPVNAPEGGLSSDSVVLLNQIRSVDKRRLGKRLGRLRPETMEHVDRALQISLGLVEI